MRIYRKEDNVDVQIPKEEQVKKYKFSWMELITNHKTGETSATGFCGLILTVVPLFLYCVLIAWYFFNMVHFTEVAEILDKLSTLIMVGAGLLGLRKATASFAGGALFRIGGGSAGGNAPGHAPIQMKPTNEDFDDEGSDM